MLDINNDLELDVNINNTENKDLEQQSIDQAVDQAVSALTVAETTQALVNNIVEAPDATALQKYLDIFNLNQSKKNALRILKLNDLLDKVNDQAYDRITKRPDEISNKELLDYMNVVSSQIDRAQRTIETVTAQPAIQFNNQKNEINVNVASELDRDSKTRVVEAIQSLLKQVEHKEESSIEYVENSDPECIINKDDAIDASIIDLEEEENN